MINNKPHKFSSTQLLVSTSNTSMSDLDGGLMMEWIQILGRLNSLRVKTPDLKNVRRLRKIRRKENNL